MKKLFVTTFTLFLLFSMQSCLKDTCTNITTYYVFEPVYMTEDQLRQEISLETARSLQNPGKMYFYQNMLFINEKFEGVHVYNNTDPRSPEKIGFISIPGNQDITIKDDVLYADALMDLISVDISDIQSPKLIDRLEEVISAERNPDGGYIVYYQKTEERAEYDCSGNGLFLENDFIAFDANSISSEVITIPSTGIPGGGSSRAGVGGSTARMTIVNEHMYLVDKRNLKAFDISASGSPVLASEQVLGWGIETIYPYGDNLFIGSETGMFIFDNTTPSNPQLLSEFEHWRACDPVVVENNTAYVTLRDGNRCAGFTNQLDVIDITDLFNPELIVSHSMTNPRGLAIRNNKLFICEGMDGLKIFDATESEEIDQNLLHHNRTFDANDVISLTDHHLFVIGEDGFFQYDVSELTNPILLSSILIER